MPRPHDRVGADAWSPSGSGAPINQDPAGKVPPHVARYKRPPYLVDAKTRRKKGDGA